MRPLKRVLQSEIVRRFFCWLASLYIRLVYHTGRWTVVGSDIPKRFWDEGKPFILGFWHGRLLLMPYCWDHRKIIHMLISEHRDGQLGAQIGGAADADAVATMADNYTRLCRIWDNARAGAKEEVVA